MANLKSLTDADFESVVSNHKGVAVVDFFAEWCGPCRFLGPIIEKMSTDYANTNVQFVKVDVDNARATAGKFNIRAVPTVIIFKDGVEVERMLGAQPETEIKSRVEKHR